MVMEQDTAARAVFMDYARKALACGEPDPHQAVIVHMAKTAPDPAWLAGVYTSVYNTPAVEVILAAHPVRQPVTEQQGEWLWERLVTRQERVVNGMGPRKLAETLTAYAAWLDGGGIERAASMPTARKAWDDVQKTSLHHGRYFAMKLAETLRLITGQLPEIDSIRPRGGQFARRTLQHIWPEHNPRDDSAAGLAEADALADDLRQELGIDWFRAEIICCNSRQSRDGKRYPGAGMDSELDYMRRVGELNPGFPFRLLEAREELFQPWTLGERQGWSGKRKELEKLPYCWSDQLWNYVASRDRLEDPIPWHGAA